MNGSSHTDSHAPVTQFTLIREFISQNPQIFVFYMLFLLILPLQDVGLPHFYGKIVQQIQSRQSYQKTFIYVVAIIICIQLVNGLLDLEEMTLQPKMMDFLHTKIVRHIFEKYSTSMEDLKTGDLFAKLIKLPFAFYDYLEIWRYFIIPQLLVYVLTGVYLYHKDNVIGVAFGVMIALVTAMIMIIPQMCHGISMQRDKNFNELNEAIDEMMKNMPAILNAGLYSEEEKVLKGFQDRYSKFTRMSMMCMIYCKMVFVVVYLAFIVYFFWRCYNRIKEGAMSAGVFVTLFTIIMYTTNSMWKIVYQVKDVIFRIGTIKESMKVFDPLEKPAEVAPVTSTEPVSGKIEKDDVIVFDTVTFRYPRTDVDDAVLNRFNLRIKRGERVLLVGKIGSGKSTALKLIMKYHLPHAGHLYLEGVPYETIPLEELRSRIGYVPQNPILFNRTIYENINYGKRHVSREEVSELIKTLGMEGTFAKFKQGLDTPVGKNGNALSGGQRQILWIMRVILQNPEVLLLDEPTASIDAETKELVQKLIEHAMEGRTVIGVTHDPFLHKLATRIITLDNGAIVKDDAQGSRNPWF